MKKPSKRKIRVILLVASFLLCLFLFPNVITAIASQPQLDVNSIDELIKKTIQRQQVPAVSVAAIRDGETTFYSHGYACRNTSRQVNEETFFYIASLSKAFTALGVQFLEHKGYLCFDDPVNKHISWLNFRYRDSNFLMEEMRIRSLLHHTSGLGNFSHSATIRPNNSPNALYYAVRDINGARLSFRPNERYYYGSVNYILLGFIIETIAMNLWGLSYEEFMLEFILAPLGLLETKMFREDAERNGVIAVGHRPSWFRSRPYIASVARSHTPTAFILSNAVDMARWLNFHLDPESAPEPFNVLIKEGHVRDATVEPSELPTGIYYHGFGWYVNYQTGRLRHTGFVSNNVSEAIFYQNEGIAVLVMMNSSSGDTGNLIENILRVIRGEEVEYISRGTSMRLLDTVFSIVAIALIVVLVGILAFFGFFIFKILKRDFAIKFLSFKRRVVVSLLILNFVVLTVIVATFPLFLGISWYVASMWMSPSSIVSIVFSILASLLLTVKITLRIIFQKNPKNSCKTYKIVLKSIP